MKKAAPKKAVKMQDRRMTIQLLTLKESELHRQLKIIAAAQEKSLKQVVIESLERTAAEFFSKSVKVPDKQ